MRRKVILDIDPGVDDAVALAVALAEPNLDVVAVTATGGTVGPEQATRNAQAIVERIDPERWPRIGAADPLQPLRTDARDLHGPKGLGGADLPVAEKANRHVATKVIAEEARRAPGEVLLVGCGPASNPAAVLARDPDAASALAGVVFLGGSVGAGGDVTPAAEFNVYCDPGSAREVFQSQADVTVVPLDVTNELLFGYELLEFLRGRSSRTATLLGEVLPGFYRAFRARFGIEGVRLPSVAAVLAAAHPGIFESRTLPVDVETAGGITHGATVFDRRTAPDPGAPVNVLTGVDAAAARDAVLRALDAAV